MWPHAKTFRTVSRFKTDSRSPTVHMPFKRLELSVLKNSSSVRTVWAIHSRKLISRSNGSSYPSRNSSAVQMVQAIRSRIHQPFEWLKLSVREIHQPFEQLELSVQEKKMSFFGSRSNKTRLQNKSPCFVKWCMPLWLHDTNSRHVSVLCLSSFNFK